MWRGEAQDEARLMADFLRQDSCLARRFPAWPARAPLAGNNSTAQRIDPARCLALNLSHPGGTRFGGPCA
jgi:hypothetical protein